MTTQIIHDFLALYTAITGLQADEKVVQIIQEAIDMGGGEEQFPKYLCSIAQHLAAGQTVAPTEIPAEERGYSWLLRELSPALPGTGLLNEVKDDIFIVSDLHLAAVITRGEETYSIKPWPEKSSSSTEEQSVLNTFDPTPEQVRQWAYSPAMRLVSQDEIAVLSHINYIPLLIELAADPACPKRVYILAIADGYVAGIHRGGYDRDLIEKSRLQASRSSLPDLQAWAQDLAYLIEYLNGLGPILPEVAREITRIALVGRYRRGLTVREEAMTEWWRFEACFPDDGNAIDWLYICKSSGALVWSRQTLVEADLVPYADPPRRDDPLRQRH